MWPFNFVNLICLSYNIVYLSSFDLRFKQKMLKPSEGLNTDTKFIYSAYEKTN